MREYLTLNELKKLDFEAIERLQNKRFQATARYLLPQADFYSNLFKEYKIDVFSIKRIHDWHRLGLPLIKKSFYMRNPEQFIVKPKNPVKEYLRFLKETNYLCYAIVLLKSIFNKKSVQEKMEEFYTIKMPAFSGGTESGNPTPVFITAKQKSENLNAILKIISELLKEKYLQENNIGMNLFPYGPHLGWHSVHHALDLAVQLNLCTAAGGAISTERLVKIAEEFKPNVFAGMSSYIRNRFLQVAKKNKIRLRENVLFINGAAKMYNTERQKIKSLAKELGAQKINVLDFYGASELKEDIMPECFENSGFHHIGALSNIIKTVETSGTEKSGLISEWTFSNKGYAVAWNIDGAGTLLEGYLLGDIYSKIERNKCNNCGLNVERIIDVDRIRDVETQLRLTGIIEEKIKGTRVNLSALRNKILSLPFVEEVQIVVKKTNKEDRLIINLISKVKKEIAIKQVQELLKEEEFTVEIKILRLEDIIGEKLKFEGIIIQK